MIWTWTFDDKKSIEIINNLKAKHTFCLSKNIYWSYKSKWQNSIGVSRKLVYKAFKAIEIGVWEKALHMYAENSRV